LGSLDVLRTTRARRLDERTARATLASAFAKPSEGRAIAPAATAAPAASLEFSRRGG
jgi:hypothetical protein